MSRIVPIREPIKSREVVHSEHARRKWASTRLRCYFDRQNCHSNVGMHTHHIVGGSGRSDEACNLIRVCAYCHRRIHRTERPVITLYDVLMAKLDHDPKEYDLDRIEELRGSAILLRDALK